MAAVPEIRPRCMIWLGRPSPQEREVLAAAGWDLRVIDDAHGARIGLRGGDREKQGDPGCDETKAGGAERGRGETMGGKAGHEKRRQVALAP